VDGFELLSALGRVRPVPAGRATERRTLAVCAERPEPEPSLAVTESPRLRAATRLRVREPERLGEFQLNHQLELRGLLHHDGVARLSNSVDDNEMLEI